MVFNPGLASDDSFASSFLSTTGTAPGRAQMLDNGGWLDTGAPSLSPANDGWYLITWTHGSPPGTVRAALGHNGRVEATAAAVSAFTAQYVGAISGDGDAIILYSGSTNTGNGAAWPSSSGLYVTIHPP